VFTRYVRTSEYVVSGGPLQNALDAQRATDRYAGGYTPCPTAIRDSRTSADSVGGITVCNEVLGENRRAQNMKKGDRETILKLPRTIVTQHPTLPQHNLFHADDCFGNQK